jgi:hypothetical protein
VTCHRYHDFHILYKYVASELEKLVRDLATAVAQENSTNTQAGKPVAEKSLLKDELKRIIGY